MARSASFGVQFGPVPKKNAQGRPVRPLRRARWYLDTPVPRPDPGSLRVLRRLRQFA